MCIISLDIYTLEVMSEVCKCACVIPRAGMDASVGISSSSTTLLLLPSGFVCFSAFCSMEGRSNALAL